LSTLEIPGGLARAAEGVAPIPRDEEGAPVFREPWEAQAFAMTLALHERGLFTWNEWAQALGAEIAWAERSGEGACRDGSDFYRHWLAAAERLAGGPEVAPRRLGARGPGDAARGTDPHRERPAGGTRLSGARERGGTGAWGRRLRANPRKFATWLTGLGIR
jgi:nitrile hydratase accessory protein